MFPQMFPCLPTRGNIVAETKFASREAKMFSSKFRNIDVFLCFLQCFLVSYNVSYSGKHGETLAGNNVSATMFSSLPRALGSWE
jgi:hypothetical protein